MPKHALVRTLTAALAVAGVSCTAPDAGRIDEEGGGDAPYAAYAPGYLTSAGVVQPVNNLPNPYFTMRNWGTLPDQRPWGSVSAIEADIDGEHIWVAERCGTNSCAGSTVDPILKFDGAGNVVMGFGAGRFIWPHGMHIDREGNVWVTDARMANEGELESFPNESNKGNAVYKFSPTGELLLTLGTPGVRGDGTGPLLAEPNDVIVLPNGEVLVSESHSGQGQAPGEGPPPVARIARFSADGNYISSFGSFGTGPGQFRTPHALAIDSQDRLFVADRGNVRIQIFDLNGTFLEEWKQFSRISGLVITSDDVLYAIDSESSATSNPGWRKGLRVGSARTGAVWYFVPSHEVVPASGTGISSVMGEGVAVDAAGNVYGGEVGGVMGVSKFMPRLLTVGH